MNLGTCYCLMLLMATVMFPWMSYCLFASIDNCGYRKIEGGRAYLWTIWVLALCCATIVLCLICVWSVYSIILACKGAEVEVTESYVPPVSEPEDLEPWVQLEDSEIEMVS